MPHSSNAHLRIFFHCAYSFITHFLQSNTVVHRDSDVLLRTQIAFRSLNGGVTEQELDLLQIATGLAAELRTGTPQIVRPEVLDAE